MRSSLLAALALLAAGGAVAQERGFCRADALGAKGYVAERIAGRLYCVSANGTMTVFLATETGVVALDALPALAEVYFRAIAEVTAAPVTHLVYSRSHLDHIGAANRMPAGAVRIAQVETARTLALRDDPRRPLPTRTFAVADTLRVAGETLVLRHHGPNHDLGQLQRSAPWFRLSGARDVPGYLALHDSILGYDFEVLVGGHLETQRDYLRDVLAAADAAAAAADYAASTAGVPAAAHPFERLARLHRAQAERCAGRVLERWRGRLPGVEVVTLSHCEAMLESRRVD